MQYLTSGICQDKLISLFLIVLVVKIPRIVLQNEIKSKSHAKKFISLIKI